MKMVIGGAFQGKYNYARKTFNIQDGWIDGETCGLSDIYTCRGLQHFQDYVKVIVRDEMDQDQFVENLIEKNPDICIVCNEVGCGVVPMDKFDREYREAVGRICEKLAARSDEVHRVVCGIGTVIKSA